jgi:hypothetical protein
MKVAILNAPIYQKKESAMIDKTTSNIFNTKNIADFLRDSIMVILTLIFVLLYATAFSGKLDPLKDNTLLIRLEPLILILTAFYFGRIPGRQNEKNLKDEIARQRQKADAAQFVKEKLQQERETLEERIRNAKTVLNGINLSEKKIDDGVKTEALRAAVRILDS